MMWIAIAFLLPCAAAQQLRTTVATVGFAYSEILGGALDKEFCANCPIDTGDCRTVCPAHPMGPEHPASLPPSPSLGKDAVFFRLYTSSNTLEVAYLNSTNTTHHVTVTNPYHGVPGAPSTSDIVSQCPVFFEQSGNRSDYFLFFAPTKTSDALYLLDLSTYGMTIIGRFNTTHHQNPHLLTAGPILLGATLSRLGVLTVITMTPSKGSSTLQARRLHLEPQHPGSHTRTATSVALTGWGDNPTVQPPIVHSVNGTNITFMGTNWSTAAGYGDTELVSFSVNVGHRPTATPPVIYGDAWIASATAHRHWTFQEDPHSMQAMGTGKAEFGGDVFVRIMLGAGDDCYFGWEPLCTYAIAMVDLQGQTGGWIPMSGVFGWIPILEYNHRPIGLHLFSLPYPAGQDGNITVRRIA